MFENPGLKPLDQLVFQVAGKDGVTLNIPALDKRWAERTVFCNYITNINTCGARIKTGVELEEWQHVAENFTEDMQFLLDRRHHEFWSYMVYQKSALGAVVSFLKHSTPFYINLKAQVGSQHNIVSLYECILSKVLRILCRIITNKESPECWIRKEHLRDLIYKNFLISVPMLFDLIVAVGNVDAQNTNILRRIFDTVLELEPQYEKDIISGLIFFRAAFRSIQTQAENEGCEGAGGGVAVDEKNETPYDDVALYTLDCSYSLSVLMAVCPLARRLGGEIKLGQSIARFYDSTIPFLYKNIYLVNEFATSLDWLNQSRLQFLFSFRQIAYVFLEAVIEKPEHSVEPSENFVALLTETLSEQTFVVDYEHLYPVALDMEILKQACSDLDDYKASFVMNGYRREAETEAYRTYGNIEQITNETQKASTAEAAAAATVLLCTDIDALCNATGAVGVINEPTVAKRDMDLEVTSVLDVLPHLGTGFVRRVLSRYQTSDQAVAAILEDNLPPDLIYADQSEEYIPPDPQDKLFEETGVKRFNVHDGDEYDIMTQDNPQCIIKRGKGMPNAPKSVAELLDDKKELKSFRHRYEEYTLVSEGSDEDEEYTVSKAEYEDEYDDSYEALLESETRVSKPKELKARLADIEDVSDDNDEEEDNNNSDEDNNTNNVPDKSKAQMNSNVNFCENPEDVRARYEARRQAKWQNRRGGDNNNWRNQQQDVVGTAKGQGQDKEVLRNRHKKEAGKASRANHNRKAGAAFKRSKGMLP